MGDEARLRHSLTKVRGNLRDETVLRPERYPQQIKAHVEICKDDLVIVREHCLQARYPIGKIVS
mgnify:CR=1 FL=1